MSGAANLNTSYIMEVREIWMEERINLTSTKYSSPANNHMEESSIVYLTVIVSVDKLSSD